MRRTAAMVVLVGLLGIGTASGAFGQSPPPSPDLIGVGGRVELPEHGIAMTFPDGWIWVHYTGQDSGSIVDRAADLKGREFVTLSGWLFEDLSPFVPIVATPGPDQWCNLFVYPTDLTLDEMAANDRRALKDAEDASFGQPGTDLTVPSVTVTDVSLRAGAAYRTDWALADTTDSLLETSDYTLKRGGTAAVLGCAMVGEPPPDRWLSIAETLEFLPSEG